MLLFVNTVRHRGGRGALHTRRAKRDHPCILAPRNAV